MNFALIQRVAVDHINDDTYDENYDDYSMRTTLAPLIHCRTECSVKNIKNTVRHIKINYKQDFQGSISQFAIGTKCTFYNIYVLFTKRNNKYNM